MTPTADPPIPPSPAPRRLPSLDTPAVKATMLVALTLLLLIPLYLVDDVNRDRAEHQEQARAEYQKSWGPSQTVLGPILSVPYTTGGDGVWHYLNIAPRQMEVDADLQPEVRRRGLFRAVVYNAKVAFSGEFSLVREGLPIQADAQLFWEKARIILGATDLRALPPDAALTWGGRSLPLGDTVETTDDAGCNRYTLLAAAPFLGAAAPPAATIPFATALELRGTGRFGINPIGRQVELKASAPWNTPSFSGIVLPSRHRVDVDRFAAEWTVTSNPTTGRWMWMSAKTPSCDNGATAVDEASPQIGVELIEPMPIYHMTERASKYAVLFLSLAFLTYFLFETIAQTPIHLVQYGLLGLSITLFGLLLISFSEPLGFTAAYAVSSGLVLGQASLFTWSVTHARGLAAIFTAILAALFGFLYVVLSLESYALLVGSVALFAALSLVMIATRRVSWSAARGVARPRREAGRGLLS